MEDIVAETIRREEEKKRFLEDIKDASQSRMGVMLSERLFEIEDFQQTQNHNSTKALEQIAEMNARIIGIDKSQRREIPILIIITVLSILGQATNLPTITNIVKAILAWLHI